MRYTSWGIIIDDIVLPNGRTAMGILGGGGMYAVAGMRLWNEAVGMLSNVGVDFESSMLGQLDLQTSLLRVTGQRTQRAWQLFEYDGHRTQIPRIPLADWTSQLAYPADFAVLLRTHGVRAVHLLSRGMPNDLPLIAQIAASGVRISLEPIIEDGMDATQRNLVLDCLQYVEIFSPGTAELRVLLGEQPLHQALVKLAECGPAIVALRRGVDGSLVYHHPSGRFLRVPAASANVIDVTGAGNAYVGGLLVGWVETGILETAAANAAVSAALMLEQIGPPIITPELLAAARCRRDQVLSEVIEVDGRVYD
jgi:sugar/nucleoside kinase (ribokinase family)